MNAEKITEMLAGGDSEANKRAKLLVDFGMFASLLTFAEYCRTKPDPMGACAQVLAIWKQRLDNFHDAEMADLKELKSDPFGALFASAMPNIEETDAAYRTRIANVCDRITSVVQWQISSQPVNQTNRIQNEIVPQ